MSIGTTYPMPGTPEWEAWMIDGLAKFFVENPEEGRPVWRSWASPRSKHGKPPEFMARLKARIKQLKGED